MLALCAAGTIAFIVHYVHRCGRSCGCLLLLCDVVLLQDALDPCDCFVEEVCEQHRRLGVGRADGRSDVRIGQVRVHSFVSFTVVERVIGCERASSIICTASGVVNVKIFGEARVKFD
jgi:hypothetical protein